MGFVLDNIIKEVVFEGPETVNADWVSEAVDMDGVEADHSFTFQFSNASSLDITIELQASTDNVTFVPIDDTQQQISAVDDGTHVWDGAGTGVSFIRVALIHTTGTLDIDEVYFIGGRRH